MRKLGLSMRTISDRLALLMLIGAIFCLLALAGATIFTWRINPLTKTDKWEAKEKDVRIINSDEVSIVWSLSDIYTPPFSSGSQVVAASKNVYVRGHFGGENFLYVIAFDGVSGKTIWNSDAIDVTTIDADLSGVYIGTRLGNLLKRDLHTGNLVWNSNIASIGSVLYLNAQDGQLYTTSKPDIFELLDAETGERIFIDQTPALWRIYWMEKGLTFGGSLKTVETLTGETVWQQSVGNVDYRPVIDEEDLYIRTGMGNILSIKAFTGNITWEAEGNYMSDVAVGDGKLFAVDENGSLVQLDLQNGENEVLAVFEPSPLERNAHSGGYYVAYDSEVNMLYVTLGDSRQLFAFEILN